MAKKMKVLHIITSLDTGGAEQMLFKLLSRIDRKRFDNRVVCLIPQGPVAEKIGGIGIQVDSLGLTRGRISPSGLIRPIRLLRDWQPDIIQTWLYHADLLGYLAARLTGTRNLIWNIRCTQMDLTKYSRVTTLTVKACALFSKFPRKILANSDIAKEQHVNTYGYEEKNFDIILNGFDLSLFKPDKAAGRNVRRDINIPEQSLCTGLVCRYDPQKDHRTFIEAAHIISARYPNLYFLLAGRGVDDTNIHLKGQIKTAGLSHRFRLLGERPDIPDIMNAMDFFCSSSAFGEGFPNVLGEAMACGLPCVATDVGQSKDVVMDTGFIVPPGNSERLAKGMERMACLSNEARRRLGLQARLRVEQNYSLDRIVRQYETLYESIRSNS